VGKAQNYQVMVGQVQEKDHGLELDLELKQDQELNPKLHLHLHLHQQNQEVKGLFLAVAVVE